MGGALSETPLCSAKIDISKTPFVKADETFNEEEGSSSSDTSSDDDDGDPLDADEEDSRVTIL